MEGNCQCGAGALANTVHSQNHLERECSDETRVSLSCNQRLPVASISGRSVGRRSARQTCPKSHNRTTRHLCRGKLRRGRGPRRWPPDARPLRLVARSSVQRTGPCWYRVRWRSGRGLCGKWAIIRCSELDGRRFTVRHCLRAPAAIARARPAQPHDRADLPAEAESADASDTLAVG